MKVTTRSATPQETFDHLFGSGATSYSWWLQTLGTGFSMGALEQPDDWEVRVTAESGDGTAVVGFVNHKVVMDTARRIVTGVGGKYHLSLITFMECYNLLTNADEADFDACSGDQLLQVIVLGEVTYA